MDINEIKRRTISFGYEALALFLTSFIAFLSSESFATLIQDHFGGTLVSGIALLIVSGVVKLLRNSRILKQHEALGAAGGSEPPILI